MGKLSKRKFSGQPTAKAAFLRASRSASAELPPALAKDFNAQPVVGQSTTTGAERTPRKTADSAKGLDAAGSARHRERGGSILSAPVCLPRWQQERARRLHRNFGSVEARQVKGQSLARAISWFAWWYRTARRFYRCEPERPIRFSEGTLRRLFYVWRDGGRKPTALILKYRSGRPKIAAREIKRFALACLTPGVCSMRTAFKVLKRPVGTVDGYRHGLGAKELAGIVALLAARRAAIRLEKTARRIVEGER